MNNMLNVFLAIVIPRVRFAREDELYGTLGIAGQFHNVIELLKDQGRALVGRKAPRKSDRERVGVKQLIEGNEIPLCEALALDEQSTPGKFNQLATQFITQGPKLLVSDKGRIIHTAPEIRRVDVCVRVGRRDECIALGWVLRVCRSLPPPEATAGPLQPPGGRDA